MKENFNMTFSTMQNDEDCYAQCYGSVNGQDFEAESHGKNILNVMLNVMDDIEKQILSPKEEEQKKEFESKIEKINLKEAELRKQLKDLQSSKASLEEEFQNQKVTIKKKKSNNDFDILLQKLFNF